MNTAEAKAVARVLTSAGGDYPIAIEHQDLFCLLSDGTLKVVHGGRLNQHVQAFEDDLRRRGVQYNVQSCRLTELRSLYASTPATRPKVAVESVRGSKTDDGANQRYVLDIIERCTNVGASDLHIVGNEDICVFRMRVHGLLEDYEVSPGQPLQIDEGRGGPIRAAVYQGMCDVADSTWKPLRPQDARMKESVVKRAGLYGARVATRALDKGQLMVLRLLYNRGINFTLQSAGFLPEQEKILLRGARAKQGAYIIAGETGSGKSTTLQAQMTNIHRYSQGRRHILTLENPPEYPIPGANQSPVFDDDWAGAIKNALRLDPDVLMIGEMRDLASAQGAFRAGLTGHLVWTTLHANDPFSILQRLDDLGLHHGMYADASLVRGLMHQYLVPVVCPKCRIPMARAVRELETHRDDDFRERIAHYCEGFDGIYAANPKGCEHCRRGHVGRVVVARVVDTNQALLDVFRAEGKPAASQMWVEEFHGITAIDHLIHHIKAGRVDPLFGEDMVDTLDSEARRLRPRKAA